MKVSAISPNDATNFDPSDNFVDVEIETIVSRINCIVARQFSSGTHYAAVPCAAISFGAHESAIRFAVLQRFREKGWKTHEGSVGSSVGSNVPVVVFTKP